MRNLRVTTRWFSHMLSASRIVAALVAAILLFQATAPAAVAAFEAPHAYKPSAHSAHHPGCPFDGKESCPHHKAPPGEPSLVQCGDDAVVTAITTFSFDVTATQLPDAFVPIGASAIGLTTISPLAACITATPETPPPRAPTAL